VGWFSDFTPGVSCRCRDCQRWQAAALSDENGGRWGCIPLLDDDIGLRGPVRRYPMRYIHFVFIVQRLGMSTYRVNKIRCPDEFRYALGSIASNFGKHAEMTENSRTITLKGLSPSQALAHQIFMFFSEVDDLVENLNMVMFDMEQLAENARSFRDRNPFNRFQFLVRMYFYEFGRFEDIFGYLTQWKLKNSLMSKDERKAHRQAFYTTYEYAIKTRNLMMHDAVSWQEQCSLELGLLQALEIVGREAVDKTGSKITWEAHLGPLCKRTLPTMLAMGQHMQVFWNMEMADLALMLVGKGIFPKATKPYVGPNAADFLRVNPSYR